MIAMRIFFFLVLLGFPALHTLGVQSGDKQIFKVDSIGSGIEINQFWKYQPGDDTVWARPDFDDSTWDTLSPQLDLEELEPDVFDGTAWFRIRLRIDSSLRNKTYALLMLQQGASEIYLDGEKILDFGTFSRDPEKEDVTNPSALPGLIHFDGQQDHVLAVRYSNHQAKKNYDRFQQSSAGFRLRFQEHDRAMAGLYGQVMATYLVLFLFMVFLILSLVHFLLFVFYRKQRSNLYYSIFMLLFSALVFITFLSNGMSENPVLMTRVRYFLSLFFPFFFVPMTGFIYSLFLKKLPLIFWITLVLATVVSLLYLFGASFTSALYIVFVFFMWVEVTRVVIQAMIKKYDGAWIIGIGVLFFILFFTVLIIYIIRYGNIEANDQSLTTLLFFLALIAAILSIPISMSIYLARDFARTNVNLEKQLEQVKILSAKTLEQEREKKRILEGQKEKLEVLVKERTKELAEEKEKTEELLLNTLPLKVVNELKENGRSDPESFDDVTVYFSDIVGFTTISSKLDPAHLIEELNAIFTAFDDIMEKHDCERIKTIGDAYLAVCGMPEKNEKHAENMVRAALAIREYMKERNKGSEIQWQIRIGIHSGRVVGGIVGVKKYIYDVFGDTINTTSRMESNSEPMRINVSETTWQILKDKFEFTSREPMEIKGKGRMRMFFVEDSL